MASRRSHRSVLTTVAVGAVSMLTVALLPGGAAADPPRTIPEVEKLLDELEHEAEVAAEEYNAATDEKAEVERRLAKIRTALSDRETEFRELQGMAGGIARASYRSGGLDPTLELMLSDDPAGFLDQASSLDRLAAMQGNVMQRTLTAANRLEQDRLALDQEQEQLEAVEERLAEQKEALADKIAESEELLASLKEEERRRLEELRRQEEQRRAEAAREAQERASRSERGPAVGGEPDTSSGSGGSTDGDSAPASPAPVSGRASVAVQTALAQVGKPYVYAANGPGSFDCSGLTSYAWRAAGVSLPRSSRQQYAAGNKVSKSDLRPGDLVYYYSPISHVAIYIGNGQIVHAANPRMGVRVDSVDSMPYAGATRP